MEQRRGWEGNKEEIAEYREMVERDKEGRKEESRGKSLGIRRKEEAEPGREKRKRMANLRVAKPIMKYRHACYRRGCGELAGSQAHDTLGIGLEHYDNTMN